VIESKNPTKSGGGMSNPPTKTERFELRLRPNIAAEAALLSELEAQDGVYGGKTELLRECLRRGFTALGAAVDSLPADATEEDILNALASTFAAGGYSYRIGKLFLDARAAISQGAATGSATPQSLVEAKAKGEAAQAPVAPPMAPAEPVQAPQEPTPPKARPAMDWSKLRHIAGSGDAESEKK